MKTFAKHRPGCGPDRSALTRAELVISMICVLFLIGIVAPIILQQRENQRLVSCQMRLNTLHSAFGLVLDVQDRAYPWSHDGEHSWAENLFPFLQAAQQERKVRKVMADDDQDAAYVTGYLCPNGRDYEPGSLAYIVNGGWGNFDVSADKVVVRATDTAGIDWNEDGELSPEEQEQTRATGVFWPLAAQMRPITDTEIESSDGLTYTILATESQSSAGFRSDRAADLSAIIDVDRILLGTEAGRPFDYRSADLGPYAVNASSDGINYGNPNSTHPGGVNVLFADGSVQFVSEKIDAIAYVRLTTPFGDRYGESVQDP